MNNITFQHNGDTYELSFVGGRPDRAQIRGPLNNNTKVLTFTDLWINVSNYEENKNFIRTTYSRDAEDSQGVKLRPVGVYDPEVDYNTSQPGANYELYISVLGPILMPLLINNMCEKERIAKPYSNATISQIIGGLQTLATSLNL